MKHKIFHQDRNQKLSNPPLTTATARLEQEAKDYVPASDEVARKAYFTYENEGSKPGRDVQHWLAAEAELIAERNLTRVHGFHNKT
jgi:hypothetical protein